MKHSVSKETKDRGRAKAGGGTPTEKNSSSRRGSIDARFAVDLRSNSATARLNVPPTSAKNRVNVSPQNRRIERTKSAARLSPSHGFDGRTDALGSKPEGLHGAALQRRKSMSQAVPTSHHLGRLVPVRSASVTSNYSTASTYDSKMGEVETPHHGDIAELRRRLQDSLAERDAISRELSQKKSEILSLRDRIVEMKRELSEVNTSKGVLNEACVSGMIDAFTLNSKIDELEEQRIALEMHNLQLRQDASEFDRERRGLLDLLDDNKAQTRELEKLLEIEVARNQEVENSRSAAVAQLGKELKWVRRELAEKTLRIRKLARTNTKLACKLLSVEAEGAEASDLAEMLRCKNSQLEGDNEELAKFVVQLSGQIDQLETDRGSLVCDMRTQQSTRLEEERASVLNSILSLEEEIEKTRKEVLDGEKDEADLQCLKEEKGQLQSRVSFLSRDIEALVAEDKRQEQAEERMREEYVQRLESDLVAAQGRIDEMTLMLKDARECESESMSSHVKAAEQMARLESDKAALQDELMALQAKLKRAHDETQNQLHIAREEAKREVEALQVDQAKLAQTVKSLEKQLAEYQRVKLETDKVVRKLKQDMRECEQQKENLAYQVNVLEWQLVGLYSEKEDALKKLADTDMDVMRLTQELEDKQDDLERMHQDISEENEAQIEACELRFEKEHLEDVLREKQRYIAALEYELDQKRKGKSLVDEHAKENKRRSRPWFSIRIQF